MPAAADLQVMIVDDQRAMRALVGGCLRELGCVDVIECADGQEALQTLAVRSVHLVISDLNMPRLDGLGLLRAIRNEPAFTGLAMIMLTSRAEMDVVRTAKELGVNNYLVKPFNLTSLKRKIEAVFGPLT